VFIHDIYREAEPVSGHGVAAELPCGARAAINDEVFQRTGGLCGRLRPRAMREAAAAARFQSSAQARLAAKIAPGAHTHQKPRHQDDTWIERSVIVVNGRTVAVQHRRAAFAV
jgi:hypothetical protein